MATRKIKNKSRAKKTKQRTIDRSKQTQRAVLRAASAARGVLARRAATSSKQSQKAVLRAASAARGVLASRTATSSKQAQKSVFRTGGSLLQRTHHQPMPLQRTHHQPMPKITSGPTN